MMKPPLSLSPCKRDFFSQLEEHALKPKQFFFSDEVINAYTTSVQADAVFILVDEVWST